MSWIPYKNTRLLHRDSSLYISYIWRKVDTSYCFLRKSIKLFHVKSFEF